MAGQAGAQACQGMRVESEFQVLVFSFHFIEGFCHAAYSRLADHKVLGHSSASVSFLT